jgi:deoxycytidylate deaminase
MSKDPRTRVGAVIIGPDREVRSTGFNGFPHGIVDWSVRLQDKQTRAPINPKDRLPDFAEARRKICTCFDLGNSAPICG